MAQNTRLNIILSADNQQADRSLEATQRQIERFDNYVSKSNLNIENSNKKVYESYVATREAIEGLFDVFRGSERGVEDTVRLVKDLRAAPLRSGANIFEQAAHGIEKMKLSANSFINSDFDKVFEKIFKKTVSNEELKTWDDLIENFVKTDKHLESLNKRYLELSKTLVKNKDEMKEYNKLVKEIRELQAIKEGKSPFLLWIADGIDDLAKKSAKLPPVAKGIEMLGDEFRYAGENWKNIATDAVHWVEKFAAALEGIEIVGRMSLGVYNFLNVTKEVPGKVHEAVSALEEYADTLKQNPFIQAAANIEQYEIRLKSLMGSHEEAARSIRYMYDEAFKGGFDPSSMIETGTILRELNLDIEETIPLVEKLAAGTGKELPQAAVALGNAFSGISGGFTQLQRTFRLTKDQLIQVGAATDEYNEITNETTKDILQNQKAIEKLINTKYANVVAEQAKTIEGTFTNFSATIERVNEQIGEVIKKPVVDTMNSITSVVQKTSSLIVPIMKFMQETIGIDFFSPVTLPAKVFFGVLEDGLSTVVEWKNTMNAVINEDLKPIIPVLGAAAAAAAGFTASLGPLIAITVKFGLLYITLAKGLPILAAWTQGIYGIGAATQFLSKGFATLSGSAANFTGQMLMMQARAIALGGALAGLMVAWGMMKEEQRKTKELVEEYDKSVEHSIEVGQKWNKVLQSQIYNSNSLAEATAKMKDALDASAMSSSEAALAIKGLQSENEKASKAYDELVESLESTKKSRMELYATQFAMFKLHTAEGVVARKAIEDQIAYLEALTEKRRKDKDETIEQNRAKIKALAEYKQAQIKIEEERGLAGEKLIENASNTEKEYQKLQRDISIGIVKTKQEEADRISAIYKKSAEERIYLEKELASVIAQLEDPGQKDEKIRKNLEQKKAKLEALFQAISGIEKSTFSENVTAHAEAMDERLRKRQSALDHEIEMGRAAGSEQIKLMKDWLDEESKLAKDRLGERTKVLGEIAKEEAKIKDDASKGIPANQTQLKLLKSQLDALDAYEKITKEKFQQTAREIEKIEKQTRQNLRKIEMEAEASAKIERDIKIQDLQDEAQLGKFRLEYLQKERLLVAQNFEQERNQRRELFEMEQSNEGDKKIREANAKKFSAEMEQLLHDEVEALREVERKYQDIKAAARQSQIQEIESRRAVLQAEQQALEERYSRGEDVSEEIKINRDAQQQKAEDTLKINEIVQVEKIKSEIETAEKTRAIALQMRIQDIQDSKLSEQEKAAEIAKITKENAIQSANLTQAGQEKIKKIRKQAEEELFTLRESKRLEDERREIEHASRIAAIRVQKDQEALEQIEINRMELEERYRSGRQETVNAFEEELRISNEVYEAQKKILKDTLDEALTHKNIEESRRAQVAYAQGMAKLEAEYARQRRSDIAAEKAARAEASKAITEERIEAFRFQIETGRLLESSLEARQKEKQAILDQLAAQKEIILAKAEEAMAQDNGVNKERIQADARAQINRAIRESTRLLQEANQKQKDGNSELDKAVAKYNRIKAALEAIRGEKEKQDEDLEKKEADPNNIMNQVLGGSFSAQSDEDFREIRLKAKLKKAEAEVAKRTKESFEKAKSEIDASDAKRKQTDADIAKILGKESDGKSSVNRLTESIDSLNETLKGTNSLTKGQTEATKESAKVTKEAVNKTKESKEPFVLSPEDRARMNASYRKSGMAGTSPMLKKDQKIPEWGEGSTADQMAKEKSKSALPLSQLPGRPQVGPSSTPQKKTEMGGSEVVGYLSQIASGIASLVSIMGGKAQASSQPKKVANNGQGPAANAKNYNRNGKSNEDHSIYEASLNFNRPMDGILTFGSA